MIKQFLVKISAYGYKGETTIEALDSAHGIENAILDKIGKKDISFVEDRHLQKGKCFLTYEEIVHGTQSDQGSLPNQKIA